MTGRSTMPSLSHISSLSTAWQTPKLLPPNRCELARLFSSLEYGERIAQRCAARQSYLVSDLRHARFLRRQAKQERLHAFIFGRITAWLAPGAAPPPARGLRVVEAMLDNALRSGDLAESLLGQQVVIEGLGETLLTRLGAGAAPLGFGLSRLQRRLVGQEHAHHTFGIRVLQELLESGSIRAEWASEKARRYLDVIDGMFCECADIFDALDEDPAVHRADVHRRLPAWLSPEPP